MEAEIKKATVPTIADLTKDPELAFENDKFNLLMSKEPPAKWVKVNKYANNSKYLPIDKIEYLLRRIFKDYKIEVLSHSTVFNAVTCVVRVHYMHPVLGEWRYQDGVGAAEVQVKAGSSLSDLQNINKNAVAMALPISKSEAIKDACHLIGDVFGGNLNRKDVIAFTSDDTLAERVKSYISEGKEEGND